MRCLHLLSILIFCTSCESYDEYGGHVVDKTTGEPIVQAKIFSYAAWKKRQELAHETYTDSSGFFEAYYPMQGCRLSKCPILRIVITKEGYKTTKFEGVELHASDTLYLESDQ